MVFTAVVYVDDIFAVEGRINVNVRVMISMG